MVVSCRMRLLRPAYPSGCFPSGCAARLPAVVDDVVVLTETLSKSSSSSSLSLALVISSSSFACSSSPLAAATIASLDLGEVALAENWKVLGIVVIMLLLGVAPFRVSGVSFRCRSVDVLVMLIVPSGLPALSCAMVLRCCAIVSCIAVILAC